MSYHTSLRIVIQIQWFIFVFKFKIIVLYYPIRRPNNNEYKKCVQIWIIMNKLPTSVFGRPFFMFLAIVPLYYFVSTSYRLFVEHYLNLKTKSKKISIIILIIFHNIIIIFSICKIMYNIHRSIAWKPNILQKLIFDSFNFNLLDILN